jgi:hypothetical protein
VSKSGRTVLHDATRMGDCKTVSMLLELGGIDLALRDNIGPTPLMTSLYHSHVSEYFEHNPMPWFSAEHGYNRETSGVSKPAAKWLGRRIAKIGTMLRAAGSPLPEIEPVTGEPLLLLSLAAQAAFSSDSSKGAEFEASLKNFTYPRLSEPGRPAAMGFSKDKSKIAIFNTDSSVKKGVLVLSRQDGEHKAFAALSSLLP